MNTLIYNSDLFVLDSSWYMLFFCLLFQKNKTLCTILLNKLRHYIIKLIVADVYLESVKLDRASGGW